MKTPNIILTTIIFILISCSQEDVSNNKTISIVDETNNINSNITFTSINISGKINTDTQNLIIERGVCWSRNTIPTINDSKKTVENNTFKITIEDLDINTNYYYRLFVATSEGVRYSNISSFTTLSFEDTEWIFTTNYSNNTFQIDSKINFYSNGTTKFNEIGAGQSYFITYGTWSLNDNILTYIWEGNDPDASTYTYTGTISGTTILGTYTHQSQPNGNWNAILN